MAVRCITLLFVNIWSATVTRDTIKHLKTFKVISNEMAVLLLILCWCYFSCLKMNSEKSFNACFYEQILFKIFVAKRDADSYFLKNSSLNSQIFVNKPSCFLKFKVLIHKYFSEEWEQICQFSLKSKLTEVNSAAMYFP